MLRNNYNDIAQKKYKREYTIKLTNKGYRIKINLASLFIRKLKNADTGKFL
jgi:hypothetical protein